MQKIVLNIENKSLEKQINELSDRLNRPIEKLFIDAIYYFISSTNKNDKAELNYKTLNPDDFATKLNFEIDETIDYDKIELFPDITNIADYINKLRKTNWRQ